MLSISIIIPTYNRAYCLPRAIDSALKQSYQAQNIIVVDDGSTDDTVSLIKEKYPQVIFIQQKNAGVSAARNNGIKHVDTDWVALLDSDDEWLPDKLEQQVALIAKNPESKLCHTEEIWIRNGVRVNQMNKHQKSGGWIFEKCLPLCAMSPSSVLMRKTLFDEVGLFREDLPACEDYDLWLKICASNPVLYLEEPGIIKYGGHEDQLSQKFWGMDRFRIKSLLGLLRGGLLKSDLQKNGLQKEESLNHGLLNKGLLKDRLLNEDQERQVRTMLEKKINIFIKGARKRGKSDDVAYYESLLDQLGVSL